MAEAAGRYNLSKPAADEAALIRDWRALSPFPEDRQRIRDEIAAAAERAREAERYFQSKYGKPAEPWRVPPPPLAAPSPKPESRRVNPPARARSEAENKSGKKS